MATKKRTLPTTALPTKVEASKSKAKKSTLVKATPKKQVAQTASKPAAKAITQVKTSKATVSDAQPPSRIQVEGSHTPDWNKEISVATRPLWQVIMLSLDTNPISSIREAHKLKPEWKTSYTARLKFATKALSAMPNTPNIRYDDTLPKNVRVLNSDTKSPWNLLVDVVSAASYLERHYSPENLPKEFIALGKRSYLADNSVQSNLVDSKKAQKTAKSKEDNVLCALLYLVVDSHMDGWETNENNQQVIVEKISMLLTHKGLGRMYGASNKQIEAAINNGKNYIAKKQPRLTSEKT